MSWLNNTVSIITGGGSGLGKALVERFINEGGRVGVLERSGERAGELAREFGGAVEVVVGDVTLYEDNVLVVEKTVERFGRLDNFVGNAGVFDFFQTLPQMGAGSISRAFDELFAVNVKAALLGAKAALAELVKSQGSLIFTVSNAGFYPGGGGPLYTASKHALVGLIRELAHELAPKIRVNGVAPGGMRTNLGGLSATGTSAQTLDQIDNLEAMLVENTPLRMAPVPADYCGPYVLLASRENSGPMTGVVINTDGGFGVRGIMKVCGGDDFN